MLENITESCTLLETIVFLRYQKHIKTKKFLCKFINIYRFNAHCLWLSEHKTRIFRRRN